MIDLTHFIYILLQIFLTAYKIQKPNSNKVKIQFRLSFLLIYSHIHIYNCISLDKTYLWNI